MARTTHTHRGNCQICDSLQAVDNRSGLLAKHGYSTRFGFFDGTCYGSDELPLQKSKDLIEGAIARAAERAVELEAAAVARRARTDPRVWVSVYVGATSRAARLRGGNYEHQEVDILAEEVPFSDGRGSYTRIYHFDRAGNRHDLSSFRSVAAAVQSFNEALARKDDLNAEQARGYVEWQRKRLANWAPSDLIPVEDKGPITHYLAHWKIYTVAGASACSASTMAARRSVGGRNTTDREKVTCSRCLARLKARAAFDPVLGGQAKPASSVAG